MKNLIAFFAFILFVATAQSQSLTQTDISGTWRVVNVENTSNNPKMAAAMNYAYFNFNTDKSFELKEKQGEAPASPYNTTSSKNSTWSYNPNTQTIIITRTKMTLKVTNSNNQVFFTDKKSGLKFEVIKPV